MKRVLFLGIAILSMKTIFAQITVMSDNKVITTGDCNMKNLTAKVKLPASAENYDQIMISLQDIGPSYGQDHDPMGASFTVDMKNVKDNTVEVMILNDGTSEFIGGYRDAPYLISNSCTDPYRFDETHDVRFVIYGGKITKYVEKPDWSGNNSSLVPEYKYTELSREQGKFKMNYGKVDPFIQSPIGSYKVPRYAKNSVSFNQSRNLATDMMTLNLGTENEEPLYVHIEKFDKDVMGTEDLKTEVTKYIMRETNPSQSGFENRDDFILYTSSAAGYFYVPEMVVASNGYEKGQVAEDEEGGFDMGMQSSKDKKSKDRSSEINKTSQKLDWKDAKFGNVSGQVVEVKYYDREQLDKNSKGILSVKSDQEGKMNKLMVFTGEKEGQVFYIFMFKPEGYSQLSDGQMKMLDQFTKGFTAN